MRTESRPTVQAISEAALPDDVPGSQDKTVVDEFERDLDLDKKFLDNVSRAKDIEHRELFAKWILGFLAASMVAVWVFVGFSGPLELSDAVLISVIFGTFAEIVGLVLVVVRYLFRS